MNGIDPVVIAAGNDWRAVEAGSALSVAAMVFMAHDKVVETRRRS